MIGIFSRYQRLRQLLCCIGVLLTWQCSQGGQAEELRWEKAQGFRKALVTVPQEGHPGFQLLSPTAIGIQLTNAVSEALIAKNRLLEIGSGVALGDVDGDGWVDVYFCRLSGGNVLYRNLGNWNFTNITTSAGVACPDQLSTGCVLADLDGDSDLDLLVTSLGGGTRCFLNDGKGRFSEPAESGLVRNFGATSLGLADVDGDGDLDVYVANYRSDTFLDNPGRIRFSTRRLPNGTEILEPADRFQAILLRTGRTGVERGELDIFYINRGGGRFVPAPWDVGVFLDEAGEALKEPPRDWGLSVLFRDINGDGLPDLYVCNDFAHFPDRIWFNLNGKRFQAAPRTAFRSMSLASMAVDVADINRDGFDDIFVADMLSPNRESRAWQRPDTVAEALYYNLVDPQYRPEVPRNTLHLARGDGTFAEIAQLAGVAATDWSWTSIFLDVDLDGWEDLLVATGYQHDVQDRDVIDEQARNSGRTSTDSRLETLKRIPSRLCPSMAFRNQRDLTFADKSREWGFGTVGIAQGMALADLDNDGDLDVVANCFNGPARLYRNESSAPRVAVRLKGQRGNSSGIGGRIRVTGGPVFQSQEMICGGRYLSGDQAMRVFAVGKATNLTIEVRWRSGAVSRVERAVPNSIYEIAEPELAAGAKPEPTPILAPLFEDRSEVLKYRSIALGSDDIARQPLLPRQLGTRGPGLLWADFDGDGLDDLVVGAERHGQGAIFRNIGTGGFQLDTNASTLNIGAPAHTGLVAWGDKDNKVCLLSGLSSAEATGTNSSLYQLTRIAQSRATNLELSTLKGMQSTSAVAVADVDGDENLDLFVGGRYISGRYPEAARSILVRNVGNHVDSTPIFEFSGLVNSAVFADLDGDGDPDLALATEWGAVEVFRNNAGKNFSRVTEEMGLGKLLGWWNGIATGDFDGDGRLDLVVSNWGNNWSPDVNAATNGVHRIYYGDFAQDGSTQVLAATWDPRSQFWRPWRERKVVVNAIPWIAERAPDHHSYGRMGVEELLGSRMALAKQREVNQTESMVFLNRGDRFEMRRLPIEAQFAPAFGVVVADWDGNGTEDLFLAQNFAGVDAETSRHDGGVGLVLLGDGKGGFRSSSPLESGVSIEGEQRGAGAADYDGDGRVDLAVTQHGGAVKLYRNTRADPGLRVHLKGADANPWGIGTQIRAQTRGAWGPVREIQAGSGHWSQNSRVSIFANSGQPIEAIEVRFPGRAPKKWQVPAGSKNIEISTEALTPR